jgi:hypothetical protein
MVKENELKWESVESYLKLIGMEADVDIRRTKELFNQVKVICPENLKDIFVSNYKETDGKEQFKDLWLFSDNYLVEIQNFVRQEKPSLEMTIYSNNIQSVSIEADKFDLSQKAKDISKLRIMFYTFTNFSVDQIATGPNCDILMYIFNTYVKCNMVTGQSSFQI